MFGYSFGGFPGVKNILRCWHVTLKQGQNNSMTDSKLQKGNARKDQNFYGVFQQVFYKQDALPVGQES